VHAIADLALRRPRALLAANLVAAALAILASIGAPGDLGVASGRLADPGPESVTVIVARDGAAGSGALTAARDVIAAQLEGDPVIEEVRVGEDEGRPFVLATLEATSAAAREEAVERISRDIDPGALRATVGGETAALIEARRVLGDDLRGLPLLAVPVVLLLAIAAVGYRAAVAPVLGAITAVAGSLALLRLTGVAFDVSALGVAPALVVGAVLGVELPALVTRLHGEEASIASPREALRQCVDRAGPLLAAGAGAASLPALGLLATPLDQAASLALGCAFAAILAAGTALTATPAAIALFGARRGKRRVIGRVGRLEVGRAVEAIRAVPRLVASHWAACAALAALALAAGLALAYPALEGSSRPFTVADLPEGSAVAKATRVAPPAGGGGSLLADLPLAAAVAAGFVAVALVGTMRTARALLAVPFVLLPAAAGLGLCVYVLDQGHLASAIGTEGRGVLDTGAVAAAVAALTAIGAARAAIALLVVRDERRLGIDAEGAADLAAALTLPAAAAASIAGVAVGAALLGSELAAVQELGLALGAGLLADLVLVRLPLLATLARWGPGEGETG
jgi:hypothetical protein